MADSKISPKDLVQKLAKQLLPPKAKEVKKRSGETIMKAHLGMICPNKDCSEEGGEVWWAKDGGWSNPYKHIKSCVFGNDMEAMNDAYFAKVGGGSLTAQPGWEHKQEYSDYDHAMHDWIKLIVNKCLPLSIVEDETFRAFSKHEVPISRKQMKKVIFKLVELVEKQIGAEMKDAGIGALMHDAWTKDSIHYLGMIASYMADVTVKVHGGIEEHKKELRLVLLSVAPMVRHKETLDHDDHDEDDVSELATKFNAEAQLSHFKSIFPYYGVEFADWAVALIGDNASVNIKTAELAKKPHVGCKNHKLNLEVNDWVGKEVLLQKFLSLQIELNILEDSGLRTEC